MAPKRCTNRALTLIELLIVVAIIAILAAIAVINLQSATERALFASNAANMHTIATGLQTYYVDYNQLPPADAVAGPFSSIESAEVGNAPAAGGSWDGIPWSLVELGYIGSWQTLFNPKYLRQFPGGKTLGNDHPRYHNFRYAYNAGSLGHGGFEGGDGNVMSGEVWIVRDLWLGPRDGFSQIARHFPEYPADFTYPWGPDKDLEMVMYADMSYRVVKGGTDEPPDPGEIPTY